eukprot:3495467-Pyramimonas_sp.AAC.1
MFRGCRAPVSSPICHWTNLPRLKRRPDLPLREGGEFRRGHVLGSPGLSTLSAISRPPLPSTPLVSQFAACSGRDGGLYLNREPLDPCFVGGPDATDATATKECTHRAV